MMPSALERTRKHYFDLNNPSAFSSIDNVAKSSRVPAKDVRSYLREQPTYTLFKKIRRKFDRRKTVGLGIGQTLQSDLADFQLWKKSNSGHSFCLIAIDVYSRFIFAIPIKQKTGAEMKRALREVFERCRDRFGHVCSRFVTDNGREYYNREVGELYKEHHIAHFSPKSEMKAAMAERAIQTLKKRLYRYLYHKSSNRWIDAVDAIVSGINRSVNRSIGMAPINVKAGDVDEGLSESVPKELGLQVGDTVRISKSKKTFEKGYTPNWTEEIFMVKSIKRNHYPPYLKLQDLNGEDIDGSFYLDEVQRVKDDGMRRIEKILRRRTTQGRKELLVKWLGYPSSHNSWIDADSVVLLK